MEQRSFEEGAAVSEGGGGTCEQMQYITLQWMAL